VMVTRAAGSPRHATVAWCDGRASRRRVAARFF
jgi:hypothetical protein